MNIVEKKLNCVCERETETDRETDREREMYADNLCLRKHLWRLVPSMSSSVVLHLIV